MGLTQYLVDEGTGLQKGLELAARIAENAPLTKLAVIHGLPRIAEGDPASGFLIESLLASIAQADDEATVRLRAFLEERAAKTAPN